MGGQGLHDVGLVCTGSHGGKGEEGQGEAPLQHLCP